VVALERAPGYAEAGGMAVQFVEVDVTHHVAPPPALEPPATLVHEHGHDNDDAWFRLESVDDGSMEAELRDRWARDLGPRAGASLALDNLLGHYREPHRRYHGVPHVLAVLRAVDTITPTWEVDDLVAVRLAAWFHDAVYDPRRADNEECSALLAERVLAGLAVPGERLSAVGRLVRSTAGHTGVTDDEVMLADADLSVLGADPAVYQAYAVGVRGEYGHIDDATWRTGRAAVLDSFLGREAIYVTPAMRPREARARANLAAERASLR
jgi:predicted metal-dependent HD superfamily phosphohydrolase